MNYDYDTQDYEYQQDLQLCVDGESTEYPLTAGETTALYSTTNETTID